MRPAIGPNITCRYPSALLAELDRIAARDGLTRAEVLRVAAAEFNEKHGGKK